VLIGADLLNLEKLQDHGAPAGGGWKELRRLAHDDARGETGAQQRRLFRSVAVDAAVPVSFVAGRGVGAIDCLQSTSIPVHPIETFPRSGTSQRHARRLRRAGDVS
jgi:hypothetical protein